jgi:hypothetical protein
MAAAAAAMCAAFACIGFTDDVATNIVDVQGYAMPGNTRHVSNREMSDLCKFICRPGGVNAGGPPHSGSRSLPELKPISSFVSFG